MARYYISMLSILVGLSLLVNGVLLSRFFMGYEYVSYVFQASLAYAVSIWLFLGRSSVLVRLGVFLLVSTALIHAEQAVYGFSVAIPFHVVVICVMTVGIGLCFLVLMRSTIMPDVLRARFSLSHLFLFLVAASVVFSVWLYFGIYNQYHLKVANLATRSSVFYFVAVAVVAVGSFVVTTSATKRGFLVKWGTCACILVISSVAIGMFNCFDASWSSPGVAALFYTFIKIAWLVLLDCALIWTISRGASVAYHNPDQGIPQKS